MLRQRENARGRRARRGWSVTTDLRVESSYVEDGRLHVLVGLNEGLAGEGGLPRGGLLNTDGWQKRSPTGSRRLRDLTAASPGLREEVLFNAEERRSRDFEGRSDARKGVSCSADFIKCAGEGKPHFIKCGFGEAPEKESAEACEEPRWRIIADPKTHDVREVEFCIATDDGFEYPEWTPTDEQIALFRRFAKECAAWDERDTTTEKRERFPYDV